MRDDSGLEDTTSKSLGTRIHHCYCLVIVSGAELLVLNDSSRRLSKEHSLYSCGSLVLHVWKDVSISVQREGRARRRHRRAPHA